MKNDKIFTTIGIAAMAIGTFSLGTIAWARYKRKNDEEETKEAIVEAAALNENFSGASGKTNSRYRVGFNKRGVPVLINRPRVPNDVIATGRADEWCNKQLLPGSYDPSCKCCVTKKSSDDIQ